MTLKLVLATVGAGSAVSFTLGARHIGIILGVVVVGAVVLRLAISTALDAKTRLWEERWTSVQSEQKGSREDLRGLKSEIHSLRLELANSRGTLSGEIRGLVEGLRQHDARIRALEERFADHAGGK